MSSLDKPEDYENLVEVALRRYEPNDRQWGFLAVAFGPLSLTFQEMIERVETIPLFKNMPRDKAMCVFQDVADIRVLIVDSRRSYLVGKKIDEIYETPFPPIHYLEALDK